MKLLVLSLAFVSALSHVKGDKPIWADEAANGAHQDALKNNYLHLITASQKRGSDAYDMVKVTYKNDPVWGNNFRCLYAVFHFNEDKKSVYAMFMVNIDADEIYQSFEEKATALKMYGYTKENAITYVTEDGQVLTDVLALSDDDCNVLDALGADETETGYELWAKDSDNVPTSCLEKFNEFAAGLPVRDVFTNDCLPDLE
ncbi:female-specific histamine-binding protein 1-like [Rhipicephalus microplus]|uniref:female-specific histamine-binding protein 1-like n=1 Tax=Rhipicephalus microplus TaxID=6941 RepID=UPI003F6D0D36